MRDDEKAYWHEVIYDVLSGNADISTRIKLNHWRSSSKDHELFYQQSITLYTDLENVLPKNDFVSESAYEDFLDRKGITTIDKLRRVLPLLAAAAALLIVFFAALSWYGERDKGFDTAPTVLIVQKGSKTKATLPDGSVIWVNSDTKLEILPSFGDKDRRIKLSGEAYFKIAHDDACPFIVEASSLAVKVHGTSFNVSNYPNDPEIRVALIEGSVELIGADGDSHLLNPQQTMLYKRKTKSFVLSKLNTSDQSAWRESKYIFKDKHFKMIVTELERMFDVDIQVLDDRLLQRKFTGDFVQNESITEILDVMASVGEFTYERIGRKITIDKK